MTDPPRGMRARIGDPTPAVFRVLGAVLLLIPFVPLRRVFGSFDGASALVPPAEWALGLVIFAVVAWLLVLLVADRLPSLDSMTRRLDRGTDRAWLGTAVPVLAVLLVGASIGAFQRSPHLIDSVVQLFQAKIFASGALEAPPPPRGGFFATQHMIVDGDGWYSQYPPGHPALLAAGVVIGAPWAVPVALSLGTVAFLYGVTRRIYSVDCARLTLVLLVLCPFFWFMGASFMNHVSALFFVSAFLYLFVRWEDERTLGFAVAAGAALGAAALSRPLTAGAVGAPFVVFAMVSSRGRGACEPNRRDTGSRRRRGIENPEHGDGFRRGVIGRWAGRLKPVVAAGVGFALVGSLYLFYNARVTGDPFLPGYMKLWGESHGLGFHATPWGGEHTPLAGLRNELLDASLLNLFLFEWPVPALLPIGAAFALGWTNRRWDRRLLLAFLAIPTAYFFYWHRDSFLGPRFLYSGVLFLLPLTARAILEAGDRLAGRSFQVGTLFRPVRAGRWVAVFLLLCAGYAVVYAIPQRFRVYATGMPSMKADVVEKAREVGIDRGLIFVKVSWGNRLLARLWGRGVPAPTAEAAYRGIDHCELHELLEKSRAEGWKPKTLGRVLEQRMEASGRLVKTSEVNGDPTLRLQASRELAPECARAVAYDQSGYTIYAPHLAANEPGLTDPYVVARDLRGLSGRIRSQYPGLPAYVYDGGAFRPFGDGKK